MAWTKAKTAFVVGTTAIALALGAGYWWLKRPQVVKFSDDTMLILMGVDYGKRHVVPGGELPKGPARSGPVTGRAGSSAFTTSADTLVVWVRAKYDYAPAQPNQPGGFQPNQNPSFQLYIYDPSNAACAYAPSRNVTGQRGDDVLAIQFDSFPRREGKLVLHAQENDIGGQEMADDKFIIPNPASGKTFKTWTPRPMPDRQTDGDLAMTLTKLVSGTPMPYVRSQDDSDDAKDKGVQVAYRVERNGRQVMNWVPVSVETTDGTGNRLMTANGLNGNSVRWNSNEAAFIYQYGLWPDEPAWKVRMQMMQTSDFSGDDEWTATNIPVTLGSQQNFNAMAGVRAFGGRRGGPAAIAVTTPPAEPIPSAETDLNGHHIKVFPAVQFTNQPANMPVGNAQPQQNGLMIQIQPAILNNGTRIGGPNAAQPTDDGMRMSLVNITDGQGREIAASVAGSVTSGGVGAADSTSTIRYTLRDVSDTTNINVTIAMHKNRFFEFTVKPEKAATTQP